MPASEPRLNEDDMEENETHEDKMAVLRIQSDIRYESMQLDIQLQENNAEIGQIIEDLKNMKDRKKTEYHSKDGASKKVYNSSKDDLWSNMPQVDAKEVYQQDYKPLRRCQKMTRDTMVSNIVSLQVTEL